MDPSVIGNQVAPAALKRGETGWREDLLAYDLLPEDLRLMIQDAPFEVDAMGVLLAYCTNARRYGSQLMALAATAGELRRFMDRALDAARDESGTHIDSGFPVPSP